MRCPLNHLLEYHSTQFDCDFCDEADWAVLKCPSKLCDFSICIQCTNDDMYRCESGHPLTNDPDRMKANAVCNVCQKSNKKLNCCEPCDFDICKKCLDSPSYNNLVLPKQMPLVSKKFRAFLNPEDNQNDIVEFTNLTVDEEGIVKGQGMGLVEGDVRELTVQGWVNGDNICITWELEAEKDDH